MQNSLSFSVRGRYALFSDPVTRLGGEKCSYHLPTYEALKGVLKSIYWKPTLTWVVDRVRIMKPIRTHSRGVKPIFYHSPGNSLSIYSFLVDVEYQVEAHFEWNEYRAELEGDRNSGKHFSIATRSLDKGGRQDVFLGVRDCQGYVEPCKFGTGSGAYDNLDELAFGLMFHGFDYPDETGVNELHSRFWFPVMKKGVVQFPRPEACEIKKLVRAMSPKRFNQSQNFSAADEEGLS